jgi:hypothetical protein
LLVLDGQQGLEQRPRRQRRLPTAAALKIHRLRAGDAYRLVS